MDQTFSIVFSVSISITSRAVAKSRIVAESCLLRSFLSRCHAGKKQSPQDGHALAWLARKDK